MYFRATDVNVDWDYDQPACSPLVVYFHRELFHGWLTDLVLRRVSLAPDENYLRSNRRVSVCDDVHATITTLRAEFRSIPESVENLRH